jgi:hypothetical protein
MHALELLDGQFAPVDLPRVGEDLGRNVDREAEPRLLRDERLERRPPVKLLIRDPPELVLRQDRVDRVEVGLAGLAEPLPTRRRVELDRRLRATVRLLARVARLPIQFQVEQLALLRRDGPARVARRQPLERLP